MRVGIIVDNDLDNDRRVIKEIEIIKSAGYEIVVLCYGFRHKTYTLPYDIKVERIRIRLRLKNILFFFFNFLPLYEWLWIYEVRKFIIRNKIGIIHAHDLYMSKAVRKGINRSEAVLPMILDLHENFAFTVNTYNWTKGKLRRNLSRPYRWQEKEKRYLSYADRIIVLSEEFMDNLLHRYSILKPTSFCVFPNVPDTGQMNLSEISSVKIPFIKNAPVIFYFGIVAERRGIFDALSAFRKVLDQGHNLNFLIIGPVDKSDSQRFNSAISSNIMKENVIYIPWIEFSELPAYLSVSDICIAPFLKNPQHESGIANKIFDYLLGKKPVVASDCKPQKNLLEKHKCGIIYRNEEEFVNAIIRLIEDEKLRSEYGENGYNAIIKIYNTENFKSNLLKLYSEFYK